MSGPIVRKYGFPNFEKIFGTKPILHGEPAECESTGASDEATPVPSADQDVEVKAVPEKSTAGKVD